MTDRMHQLIEGLIGIEVIADDFLVCGSGKSAKEALASHDKDLHSFLEYARDWGLKLNKLLVSISTKPFHNTPKRLQYVLLHLQRYNLVITYKKGKKCI